MREAKERISSAIDRARADLELASHDLEKLPVVSQDALGFASHALNNYITVTGGAVGYGLAVAKEFIDKLGGTIWCESRPGEGSCFAFRLTRYQEQIHGPGRSEPWPSTENTTR